MEAEGFKGEDELGVPPVRFGGRKFGPHGGLAPLGSDRESLVVAHGLGQSETPANLRVPRRQVT